VQLNSLPENLAAHRTQLLTSILPVAVIHGVAEMEPEREPLKDTSAIFDISQGKEGEPDRLLSELRSLWSSYTARATSDEEEWLSGLEGHLENLVAQRLNIVDTWLNLNTSRFSDTDASIGTLRRTFAQMSDDIKSSIQLCKLKCADCHLRCLFVRKHDGPHNCTTDHHCTRSCQYEGHGDDIKCGVP
jgi:hypothetical protein